MPTPQPHIQSVEVYPAHALRVESGANLGDPVSVADDLVLDDIYRLGSFARPRRMRLSAGAQPPFVLAPDTETGQPGAEVHLDCALTFMSGNGIVGEALVLVETDADGHVEGIYLMPLAAMRPQADYALVGIDRGGALRRFAQAACMSFTRGTLITMAGGDQRPVETLAVGDRVLTRDDGAQAIRWIGHATMRAVGAFAPIRIRAGTLYNAGDLVVSPDHRLLVYQRVDALGAGRAELLVKARHLVNGDTVRRMTGGFVEYYQMLFDRHQIIYAEGIAAESMLLDTRTRAALPADLTETVARMMSVHRGGAARAIEVGEALLDRTDAAEILRRSAGD